ncbi:MAG: hypothetical protein HS115_08135 [Spirochaetales bacterium]|nr:hypothetical protein [Spirochaetales bacterium]
MRQELTKKRLQELITELGQRARGPGKVYLVGGASALLEGWRDSTIDLDLKLDPEPAGVFEAIRIIKEKFQVNIELAAPDQFLPPLPGWQDRSIFIERCGSIDFFHYDFYSQALAKIERSHNKDLLDVRQMLATGLVVPDVLIELFARIKDDLIRFPALEAKSLENKLKEILGKSS